MLTTYMVMALLADCRDEPESSSSWVKEHRDTYNKAFSLANEYIKHGKTRGGYVDVRIVGTDHNLETGVIASIEMMKEIIQQKKVVEYNKLSTKAGKFSEGAPAPQPGIWTNQQMAQWLQPTQQAPTE